MPARCLVSIRIMEVVMQTGSWLKRASRLLVVAGLTASLGGCIIAPYGYPGYYHHPHYGYGYGY